MLLECINTSVWNLFIIPEEDWSQSKSIEEYEVNKLKNEDGYSYFYAFIQLHVFQHTHRVVFVNLLMSCLQVEMQALSSRILHAAVHLHDICVLQETVLHLCLY